MPWADLSWPCRPEAECRPAGCGRHNGVCLLHGDDGRRTAPPRVPATIVLRRAFISRRRHNPFIPPGR